VKDEKNDCFCSALYRKMLIFIISSANNLALLQHHHPDRSTKTQGIHQATAANDAFVRFGRTSFREKTG
jgi:hypothetical protein